MQYLCESLDFTKRVNIKEFVNLMLLDACKDGASNSIEYLITNKKLGKLIDNQFKGNYYSYKESIIGITIPEAAAHDGINTVKFLLQLKGAFSQEALSNMFKVAYEQKNWELIECLIIDQGLIYSDEIKEIIKLNSWRKSKKTQWLENLFQKILLKEELDKKLTFKDFSHKKNKI